MDKIAEFQREIQDNIRAMDRDAAFKALSREWFDASVRHKYSYNFSWMGRPIIQHPQDIVAMQEIIWKVQPDLIVETGIAHGGSLIFHASMLELLGGDRQVLGVDIEVRPHNRQAIEAHPMFRRITMLEGSSVDPAIFSQVQAFAGKYNNILVILDSNHSHDHVLAELNLYAQLVKKGGYLVVLDTVVEDMDQALIGNRPWSKGNSPKTAVWEFLKRNDRFEIDRDFEAKLVFTSAPDGWLKCVKN